MDPFDFVRGLLAASEPDRPLLASELARSLPSLLPESERARAAMPNYVIMMSVNIMNSNDD